MCPQSSVTKGLLSQMGAGSFRWNFIFFRQKSSNSRILQAKIKSLEVKIKSLEHLKFAGKITGGDKCTRAKQLPRQKKFHPSQSSFLSNSSCQLFPIDLILFKPRLERGMLSLVACRTLQVLTKISFGIFTQVKPCD